MGGASAVRIGLDLGGTTVRAGYVRGGLLAGERREAAHLSRRLAALSPAAAVRTVLDLLERVVRDVLREAPDAAAIGIAFPGFIDPISGRLGLSPNLPGLLDVDLAGPLSVSTGLAVAVENDALCAAWGERHLHARRPEDLLYVGLGTGVGGGAVLGGRPWRGAHGVAMEVGHLIVEAGGRPCGCGARGCLETLASATGVCSSYAEATGQAVDAREVARRARGGDGAARQAFARAGTSLGVALAHVLKVLDVAEVVIGGGLSRSSDLYLPALESRLAQDLLPVQRGRVHVVVSTAEDRAGMLGAALLAPVG